MATVYILYSKSLDRFYTGSCLKFDKRIIEHLEKSVSLYTKRADDWETHFTINDLKHSQARKIENHIKRMKSKTYLRNIVIYPDISQKLILTYK